MKIGTPPPGNITATPVQSGQVRQTARNPGNFANLLRSAQGDGPRPPAPIPALPLAEITAGGNRFSVETQIGDDAIRFDARPIVGPTATPVFSDDTDAKAAGPADDIQPSDITPPREELIALVVQIADRIPPLVTMPAQMATDGPSPPAPTISAQRTDGAAPRFPLVPQAGLLISPPLIVSVVGAQSPEAAAPPPPTPTPTTSHLLAARVAALPREVIVALHGVTLSSDDMLMLADTIRQALAQYRLEDRPVRIFGTGGKR